MKLIGGGLERTGTGGVSMKLLVSSVEDLWALYNFLMPGDSLTARTVRKVVRESSTGTGTAERRVLMLRIDVLSTVFDAGSSSSGAQLRVAGVNRTPSDWIPLSAHHTIDVECDPPQTVIIEKPEWHPIFEERLREACDEDSRADTAAVVFEHGFGSICLINGSLCVTKRRFETSIPKKRKFNASARDDNIQKFFQDVVDGMLAHIQPDKVKVILICSPGTVREELLAYLVQRGQSADAAPELKALLSQRSKFLLVKVSSGHRGALTEALADPVVVARMQTTKCAEDSRVWAAFQTMLNVDPDRVCYGPQLVHEAHATHSAVDVLLITDSALRAPDTQHRRFYHAVVDGVKNMGGTVQVFSSQHVTGDQLQKLTGIAAILRRPLPELDDVEPDRNFMQGAVAAEMVMEHTRSSAMSRENS